MAHFLLPTSLELKNSGMRQIGPGTFRSRTYYTNKVVFNSNWVSNMCMLMKIFSLFHQRADNEALTRLLQTSLFLDASPILVKSIFFSFRSSWHCPSTTSSVSLCWWKWCVLNWNRSWTITRNSFCTYIDENDASLIEIEAGAHTLIKIICF